MGIRLIRTDGLPVKRLDGETVHALKPMEEANALLLSPDAHDAFKKHIRHQELTPDEETLIVLCLEQSMRVS